MFHRTFAFFSLFAGTLLIASGASAGPIAPSNDTSTLLQEAVNGSWRSVTHKARDQYRHPIQTLGFFGIKPDMAVIELSPGGGWYTEILAPFLYEHGHLIEASSPKAKAFDAKLKADPAVYGHIESVIPFAPPGQVSLGPDNSADMVLTFRNTHDWLNHSPETLASVFKATYDVLKSGGIFGIVEHRAKPYANAVESSKALHRIPEDYMIEVAFKAGFRLVAVSDINANPKDPGDINVHHMLPDLDMGDTAAQKKEYEKLGESDRMTLKFVKP